MSDKAKTNDRVFTPLGIGKIVYSLPNGTYVVEFPSGGGHIFYATEIFRAIKRVSMMEENSDNA